ncbi:MAG: HupE/UreJ family protein [Azoarcus sp.]|nr:HupE/UreJ family protein [Azoarcus sp.]MDX9837347.1 HupE/UreJ family protein [Azoarcus sp.]
MSKPRALVALALLLTAGAATAHPGHETISFASGFGHPLGGIDHMLAMLAVGLYAAHQRGTARWALPAGFIAAMLSGAALGAAGIALPGVEAGVSASLLVFGLLIAFAVRLPLTAAIPLISAFALFHGHAHHAEMASNAFVSYTAGFALATAALHAIGYLAACHMPESRFGAYVRRTIGLAIGGAGILLLGA